jgi:uncharacterized protein YjbI with pentapeptide repeats
VFEIIIDCVNYLTETNVSEANLSEASLCEAILINADLSDTDLIGADLSGADLTGANLTEVILDDATVIEVVSRNNVGISHQLRSNLQQRGTSVRDSPAEIG